MGCSKGLSLHSRKGARMEKWAKYRQKAARIGMEGKEPGWKSGPSIDRKQPE